MVERFELDFHGPYGEDAYMAKAENGEFVRYSDYAALEATPTGREPVSAAETTADTLQRFPKIMCILSDLGATPSTEPWQVKDHADGWIDFATAEEALAEVRVMGSALIRPALTAALEGGKVE